MDWRLGTMGFSYGDWAGPFYPSGMKAGDYLGQYAKHFDAVELDTTFHATPPGERFRRWAGATPPGFRFSVKTPRAVTHDSPPDRALGAMLEFLDAARELGEKLGVVLIQFPPGFQADQFARVEAFLAALPTDLRYAVELRNRTWGSRRTLEMLRRHRCGLVAAEYLTRPGRVHVTTDFVYVRWIGQHGRFATHEREQIDVSASLGWWKGQLEAVAPEVKTVWGFFNNDYAGYGVGTCNRFKGMLGLAAVEPPEIPGGLFG